MIHSFELENFKAFGKRTKIPMGRRITLLFGQNSVGKTSIMQALALLSDALESNASDGRLDTTFGNTGVDLGGFEEFVYDHDVQRQVCIRVNVPIDSSEFEGALGKLRVGPPHIPIEAGAVEWRFAHAPETGGGRLDEVHVVLDHAVEPEITFSMGTLEASAQAKVDAMLGKEYMDSRPRSRVIRGHRGSSALAVCRSFALDEKYLDHSHEGADIAAAFKDAHAAETRLYEGAKKLALRLGVGLDEVTVADALAEYDAHLNKSQSSSSFSGDTAAEDVNDRSTSSVDAIADYGELDAEGLYSDAFPIDEFCARLAREENMRVADLDGIVLADTGFLLHHVADPVESLNYLDTSINECAAEREKEWCEMYESFLTSTNLTREIQLQVRRNLKSLHWIGEARSAPERVYNIGGSIPGSVGPTGGDIAGYLRHNPQVVADTNNWLADLNIQYSIEVQTLEPSAYGVVALRLHDTSRDPAVDAAFSDVGYGISQVLPLIVQGVGQRAGVIVIQQPEVHIHPRLQADLGDFFIKESATKQFLIETHSEHLVLRLLRHVREPGEASIDPDDLVILYVESGPDGPSVKRIRVDEDGDFLDEWPGGFFPERLDEVL